MASHWRLTNFYHTIINARDLEETLSFYELLGFLILSDRRNAVWPDGSGASFGLVANPKGRGVLMVVPSDPEGPMLDIIQWLEPEAEFLQFSPKRIPRVLAFRTEDVWSAHAELKAHGVKFTTDVPTSIPEAGIDACIVACDPNGVLIELIQLAPGLRHSKIAEVFSPKVR